MDSKPIWLLDVDGVLNANRPGWGAAPRAVSVYPGGVHYRLRFAPELIARIRAVHASGAVEIVWSTTWVGHTDLVEAALQLPKFREAFAVFTPGAKAEAALAAYGEDRLVIWTDDEAIPADFRRRAPGALLIRPKPNKGLQPIDLFDIEHFLGIQP